ncbi:hypothetical protein K9N68_39155 (plasmid) [Kovacikia minuta CCNUW1]|uniref:hypothetical protein n=1 Tax=Kovacikia minuta TaxID=2931930 RepID=UPI001CCDCE7B|nr:hypothetical protein [Kovacikia minuta]UBF30163.1 hypothetical protein K9N68_39155 [Kovacikia minuta CCNUW1]
MERFVTDWLLQEQSNHSRRLHQLKRELAEARQETRGRYIPTSPDQPLPQAAAPVDGPPSEVTRPERAVSQSPILKRQVRYC